MTKRRFYGFFYKFVDLLDRQVYSEQCFLWAICRKVSLSGLIFLSVLLRIGFGEKVLLAFAVLVEE